VAPVRCPLYGARPRSSGQFVGRVLIGDRGDRLWRSPRSTRATTRSGPGCCTDASAATWQRPAARGVGRVRAGRGAGPPAPLSAERAGVLAEFGEALMIQARHRDSRALCEEAIAIASQVGVPVEESHARWALGVDLATSRGHRGAQGGVPDRRDGRQGRRSRPRADPVGWPGGVAPPAPTDPGVSLSAHRALVALVTRPRGSTASGQTCRGRGG
jgi:hypothetical protein